MALRLCFVAASLMLAATLPTDPAVASEPTGSASAEAVRFRTEFGFSVEQGYLWSVQTSPTSAIKYGVPLTAEEEADMDARMAAQEALDPLTEFVSAQPDRFGGVWLDQQATRGDGFVINVLFAGTVDPNLAERVSTVAPAGVSLNFASGDFSESELERAVALVDVSRGTLAAAGVNVSRTRIDTAANRVEVLISSGKPEILSSLHPGIVVRTGVRLEPVACNPSDRCTYLPYRGGLQLIDYSSSFGWWQCTSGFWSKKSGIYYFLTSAHCWRSSIALVVYRDTNFNTRLGTWTNDSIPGPGLSCNGTTCYANTETAYLKVDSASFRAPVETSSTPTARTRATRSPA